MPPLRTISRVGWTELPRNRDDATYRSTTSERRHPSFIGKNPPKSEEKTEVKDVFVITPDGDHADFMKAIFDGCCSVSVWPFYLLLTLLLLAGSEMGPLTSTKEAR